MLYLSRHRTLCGLKRCATVMGMNVAGETNEPCLSPISLMLEGSSQVSTQTGSRSRESDPGTSPARRAEASTVDHRSICQQCPAELAETLRQQDACVRGSRSACADSIFKPVLEFAGSSYGVVEAAGSVTVEVKRTGDTCTANKRESRASTVKGTRDQVQDTGSGVHGQSTEC